jgi:ectoine hydroxylase-related dioxygenase (phytanoyl-CoA dioxygenase family)
MDTSLFRFDTSSSPDAIHAALETYGCAIVEGVISKADLVQLRAEITPHLDGTDGDLQNPFNGVFTKRFGRLMYRVPKARALLQHPLVLAQLDRALLRYAPAYKLTFDGVMHVMAGQKAQVLHRDNVPFENPAPPMLFATLWAVEDFCRENGATVFVPGSHLWPEDRHPTRDTLAVAEMPAGSVLLYYGNLIHGAGQCRVGTRMAVSLQYAVSWLQQEENQALSVPIEVLRTFDADLLKLLGFDTISRNCGSVNGQHPLDLILQDGQNRSLAQPGYNYSNGRCLSLMLQAYKLRTADHHYHVTLDE